MQKQRFTLYLTPEQWQKAQRLAQERHLSMQDLFRSVIEQPEAVPRILAQIHWSSGLLNNDLKQTIQMIQQFGLNPLTLDRCQTILLELRQTITAILVQYSRYDQQKL